MRAVRVALATALVLGSLAASSAPAFATGPVQGLEHIGRGTSYSTNWSGYAAFDPDTAFTDVKGNWTVPTADCSAVKGQQFTIGTAFSGLDGYNNGTVEQTGTDFDCIGKTPYYVGWYEFYPDRAIFLDQGTYPVSHGDHMSAHVYQDGTTVTTKLTDNSTNPKWTATGTTSASGLQFSSAEWILESPAHKLTPFGSISFTGSKASDASHTDAPISTFTNDQIFMVKGHSIIASPSALTGGTDFSVSQP
jgi:hypothetical protein